MTFYEFQTTTHGKWILAGEHAVIRGHAALVLPILEKKFNLQYHPGTTKLTAHYEGESGADTHLLFWSVLEEGAQLLERSLNSLSGHFNLYNDIPVGVGLGASAALCVAMARWFAAQKMLPEETIAAFAKQLENLFHGQSSGLDVAGVAAHTATYFKQGECRVINQTWQPNWALSSCGQIGITSHCIQQVQALWETNPSKATEIDNKMLNGVTQARLALEEHNASSLSLLAQAINAAADCFQEWGLVSDSLQQHIDALRKAGAIAVKPTGSGGGGYVVSLWETHPTAELGIELIYV